MNSSLNIKQLVTLSTVWTIASAVLASAAPASDKSAYLFKHEPARYALVVGNSTYANQSALPSVTEDIQRTAERLRALHFEVTVEPQFPSVRDFEDDVLPKFRRQIQPGDIVLFYFSGHGFAYGQNNFIAPADLPRTVATQDVTSAAIAVENLEDYLARRAPGLILIVVDACRSIAGFVVSDQSNHNMVLKGMAEVANSTNADNALFAFASRPGTAALATSESGKPSVFTSSLDAHIDSAGSEFGVLFKDISAEVAVATANAQRPGLVVWSDSDLYLIPSPGTLAEVQTAWSAALDSNRREAVQTFLRRFSTSLYAAAARKWLDDHPTDPTSSQFSAVSPLAVDRAWSAGDASREISYAQNGLAYPQYLDSAATQRVENLDDASLGLAPAGTQAAAGADEQQSLASLAAHGSVIPTRNVVARTAPSDSAGEAQHVRAGTLLSVDRVECGVKGDKWLAASLPGQSHTVFVPADPTRKPLKSLSLGKSLREIQVPPRSAAFPDLIDAKVVRDAISELKSHGHTITWASIATGIAVEERESLTRASELTHAEFVLKESGLDSKHITALAGVSELKEPGVRLRLFGR